MDTKVGMDTTGVISIQYQFTTKLQSGMDTIPLVTKMTSYYIDMLLMLRLMLLGSSLDCMNIMFGGHGVASVD